MFVLYIETDDKHRRDRMKREGIGSLEFRRVERHPTEQDVKKRLREEANDVVGGDDLQRGHRDALRVLERIVDA